VTKIKSLSEALRTDPSQMHDKFITLAPDFSPMIWNSFASQEKERKEREQGIIKSTHVSGVNNA
jgi:hypothetical protein